MLRVTPYKARGPSLIRGWNAAGTNQAKTDNGWTALMQAAHGGHLEVTRLLLDRSADPNLARTDNGTTALMTAAYHGHLEVVRLLLGRSADPNQASDDGSSALTAAAEHGHLQIARLLLDRSADPNQARTHSGETALIFAAWNGHPKTVQLLLVHGANPAVVITNGLTAHTAARNAGHQTIADCLDAIEGWPVFKIAVACRLHTDARAMLKRGAIDPAGCTRPELMNTITVPNNTLWEGSPAPCFATTALVNAAMSSWSPSRHFLYHPAVRASTRTVFLVAEQLRRRHTFVSSISHDQLRLMPPSQGSVLTGLPNELWCIVCSFFCRADWPPV